MKLAHVSLAADRKAVIVVSDPTHQTVHLGKGKHACLAQGACVMELASVLAGEPFSDRPATACPVIAGFLRAYNDRIDDDRRQDLYRYAAAVVGTRGSAELEEARERRCLEWVEERKGVLGKLQFHSVAQPDRRLGKDAVGTYAARSIRWHTDRTHASVLALIDELIAMGRSEQELAPDVQPVSTPSAVQVLVTA